MCAHILATQGVWIEHSPHTHGLPQVLGWSALWHGWSRATTWPWSGPRRWAAPKGAVGRTWTAECGHLNQILTLRRMLCHLLTTGMATQLTRHLQQLALQMIEQGFFPTACILCVSVSACAELQSGAALRTDKKSRRTCHWPLIATRSRSALSRSSRVNESM
jgi:hypothetical protein